MTADESIAWILKTGYRDGTKCQRRNRSARLRQPKQPAAQSTG